MSYPSSAIKSTFTGDTTLQQYRSDWRNAYHEILAKEELLTGNVCGSDFLNKLNDLHHGLYALDGQAGLWTRLHPDPGVREEAREARKAVSVVETRLELNVEHAQRMAAVDLDSLDPLAKRFVEVMQIEYKTNGALLDPATRSELEALQKRLTDAELKFETAVDEDERYLTVTATQLEGLPEDFVRTHPPGDDGKITLTTQTKDWIPIMTFCRDDSVREQMSLNFLSRGHPVNQATLQEIVQLRQEIATKLGFQDWANLSLATESIGSAKRAAEFVAATVEAVKPAAADAEAALRKIMQEELPGQSLQRWQIKYAENIQSARELDGFDEQKLQPYLRLGQVRKGLFALLENQFKLKLVEVHPPIWHPTVKVYNVLDLDNKSTLIGMIYMDLHPRKDKYGHACCGVFQYKTAEHPLTMVDLTCNFPEGDEAELTYDQARTFLHETFHGAHALCGSIRGPWCKITGFDVETDFVEVPSQVIEAWLECPEFLATFATNTQGELIPADYIAKLHKRDQLHRALMVRGQMSYALLSLNSHSKDTLGMISDVDAFEQECTRLVGNNLPAHGHLITTFTHLTSYSAKYYGYMWASAINKDLLSAFKDGEMMDTETCMRLRRTILEQGSSKPALELVQDFLGRPFCAAAFAVWLQGKD